MRTPMLLGLLLGTSCSLSPTGASSASALFSECRDEQGSISWREAQALLSDGNDEEALISLLATLNHCPDLVRAHIAYQDAAKRLGGKQAQAMIDFYADLQSSRSANQRSPVPAYMRARLTETAYAQSNALDQILGEFESFGWGFLSRGRINRGQGRLSEALNNLDAAIVNDSSLIEARLERAQVLVELGRDEEAAVEFRSYLQERPGDLAAVREYITLLLYRLPRVDEALKYLDWLEQQGEKSPSLRMDRAAALWRAKRPQAAVEVYLEILTGEPTMARAALNIGLLYYEILPENDADRRRYWPKARAAFELFLQGSEPHDGYEQFERTWAVPYRLGLIGELLGESTGAASLDDLRWPGS